MRSKIAHLKSGMGRSIAFIVNGDAQTALGIRARSFRARLSPQEPISIFYRGRNRLISLVSFYLQLVKSKPGLIYVFDMGFSGVLAALSYKRASGAKVIIETGDVIYELAKSVGRRAFGLWLTRLLEEASLKHADFIVVRGSKHKQLLAEQGIEKVEVIPDGVDTNEFIPMPVGELRRRLNLSDELVVGFVGSSIWSERLQLCYGWELIEALNLLKDQAVKGLIIGGGSGIPRLKARAEEYGIEDKVTFLGPIPYQELPQYINLIDICLSTQTNDLVGQVRTTGKLPLYLACGRYVLASRVGEAGILLPDEMLLEYNGVKDADYPRKLAERILLVLQNRQLLDRGASNIELAKTHFDYSVLAERLRGVFARVLESGINA